MQADAPVLRQTLLGDVELRHDLDTGDDERRHGALRLQHLAQHSVHAEAHDQAILERLHVDVGGVLLHRLGEHGVDQPDDRRIVVAVEEVRLLRQFQREVRQVGGIVQSLDGGLHGVRACLIDLPQQQVELRLRHALEPDRPADEPPDLRQGDGRGVLAIDALGFDVRDLFDEHAVALREREGKLALRGGGGLQLLVHDFGGAQG